MLGTEELKEYMREKGIRGEIVWLKPGEAKTSAEAARAVGCELGQIAKNIILVGESGVILVITSGDKRVDLDKVSRVIGERVKLASPKRVLEETGFPVGGVPPFGHRRKLRTIIDPSIRRYDYVYTSGGSEDTLLKIETEELIENCDAEILDVSR